MENALISILPAFLIDPLPPGWDTANPGFVIEVADALQHSDELLPALATVEPDVLLLDADDPGIDAFALTAQALTARPGLAVVIISHDAAPDRLRRAMLSGAEEYLIKPLDSGEMREAIQTVTAHRTLRRVQRATQPAASKQNGVVVGIVAGKGGLGKTTLACNLATLAAKSADKTAALVGLESGDGSVLLSLQPRLGLMDLAATSDSGPADSYSESTYGAEWLKQFATLHKSGLYYWSWQGTSTSPDARIPDDFFHRLFATFRDAFAVTVVDFPLLSADEVATVLPLLDMIVVVSSSSDLLALRSTKTFLDLIPHEVNDRIHIIINRADASDMISREDFERNLGRKATGVVANEASLAAEAINMGTPFVLTQPNSNLTNNMQELAQALFQLPVNVERDGRKKRFRLFG
jgi:pilus assembly protein CpaE